MWWIPLATAAMGALQAKNKASQQEAYNKGQAEVTRYSPWTGMKGQIDNSYKRSMLEGAAGGGIQGLGIAQGFGAFGNQSSSPIGGPQSGIDQNIIDNQSNPWAPFSEKKYNTFQRTA